MTQATERRADGASDALMSAFTAAFFAVGYDAVTISDVAERAGVARSTFYEYFKSKRDILAACLEWRFAVVADCIDSDVEPSGLQAVLEHFYANRRRADAIFTGAPRKALGSSLAGLIEPKLGATAIPARLAAIQLAESQLSLLEAWLRGRARCDARTLGRALYETSRAAARAHRAR